MATASDGFYPPLPRWSLSGAYSRLWEDDS